MQMFMSQEAIPDFCLLILSLNLEVEVTRYMFIPFLSLNLCQLMSGIHSKHGRTIIHMEGFHTF